MARHGDRDHIVDMIQGVAYAWKKGDSQFEFELRRNSNQRGIAQEQRVKGQG